MANTTIYTAARAAAAAAVLAASTVCFLVSGCGKPELPRLDANTLLEIEQLRTTNQDLRKRVRGLEEQVSTLQTLGDKRIENLYLVQRIRLGASTGGVGLDKDAGDDGVKATIEPIDQHGSILKAAGAAKVQVFDLALPEGSNLLAECVYDANTAAKNWIGGMFGGYYSFQCPWRAGPPIHNELTVRAEFTEYLTGKTYTAQKVIKVDLTPMNKNHPVIPPATAPATAPAAVAVVETTTQPAAAEPSTGPATAPEKP